MEIKHYIFDYLSTADGYEIGWLHEDGQKNIENEMPIQIPTPGNRTAKSVDEFSPQSTGMLDRISSMRGVTAVRAVCTVQSTHSQTNEQKQNRKG